MIIKWMRYYLFYPGCDNGIDKARRMELKHQLKLPHGFGQKLASCVINKFNAFEKMRLVVRPPHGALQAQYYPETDIWLSPTWDGTIDALADWIEGEATSISLPLVPCTRREKRTMKVQKPRRAIEHFGQYSHCEGRSEDEKNDHEMTRLPIAKRNKLDKKLLNRQPLVSHVGRR